MPNHSLEQVTVPDQFNQHKNIDHFENWSTERLQRLRVVFKNGYIVSIIRGNLGMFGSTYGGEDGLFEIAVMQPHGLSYTRQFFDPLHCDDVLGFLTVEDVRHYLNRVGEAGNEH